MPKDGPLTQEEKDEFKKTYITTVENINKALPDDLKVKLDLEGLDKKLNDVDLVNKYRLAVKLEEQRERQKEIEKELMGKFGKPPFSPMNRNFCFVLKVEDTPEAKEYNEKVYKEYLKDPAKVTRDRFMKVFGSNPKEFAEAIMKEDDYALLKLYEKDPLISEDGFVVISAFRNVETQMPMNQQLQENKDGFFKCLELYNDAKAKVLKYSNSDIFTVPEITQQQAQMAMNNPEAFGRDQKTMDLLINNAMGRFDDNDTMTFFKKAQEKGLEFTNDFFIKNKAVIIDENGKEKQVSLKDTILDKKGLENARIVPRSEEEIYQIKTMTMARQTEVSTNVLNFVMDQFAAQKGIQRTNDLVAEIEQIKEANKGGFFENLFNTTSPQFKEFRQALTDFGNKDSKDYGNAFKLKEKAMAYLERKHITGLDDPDLNKKIEELDSTGKGRAQLCVDVLKSIAGLEKEDAMEVSNEIPQEEIKKEPAFKDVTEIDKENIEIDFSEDKNLVMENEKGLEP